MNTRFGSRRILLMGWTALAIASLGCELAAGLGSSATPAPTPTLILTGIPASTPTTTVSSGPFRLVMAVNQVLPGQFESFLSDSGGGLWLITDQGVARLTDGAWTMYLAGRTGRIVGVDAAGHVWTVSEDTATISAWDGQAWTAYGSSAGWTPLAGDYFTDVHAPRSDHLGRVWLATSQDVRMLDGERWNIYTPEEMGFGAPAEEDIRMGLEVAPLSGGTVWVSECDWGGPGPFGGRGIRWLDQGTWHGASSPVASGCAIELAEDSQGRVWAGVDDSLWLYQPASGEWTGFSPPESPVAGMRVGFVDSLAVDPHGGVWPVLALCGGASCFAVRVLCRFLNGQWEQVKEPWGVDDDSWGPLFDAAGVGWLGQEDGVYRLDGASPKLASPLASRTGVIDDTGRLWIEALYEGRESLWVLDPTPGNWRKTSGE